VRFFVLLVTGLCDCKLRAGFRNLLVVAKDFSHRMEHYIQLDASFFIAAYK
jgi:hypothetical protein